MNNEIKIIIIEKDGNITENKILNDNTNIDNLLTLILSQSEFNLTLKVSILTHTHN